MINNNCGLDYTIECDLCGDEATCTFDTFEEAIAWKKDKNNGWKSKKTDFGWMDLCPECQEGKNERD